MSVASSASPEVSRPAPLVTDASGVGLMVEMSARSIRRMNSAGRLPRPVKIGGAVKWRVAEIEAWVRAGCPDRKAWEAMQKS